jgi:hypothetical protein
MNDFIFTISGFVITPDLMIRFAAVMALLFLAIDYALKSTKVESNKWEERDNN